MDEYLILLPGDETAWEQASPEQRAAVYEQHGRFAQVLAERGHTIVGGAELTHSREARVVRGTLDDVSVTEGPYAETVEQLTGFYQVRTADLDDLFEVCGLLAGGTGVEVRPVAATSSGAAEDAS